MSQEDKIEQARNDCILNVAAYVKANPRARPMEIQKKVQDEIEIFKAKIQWLELLGIIVPLPVFVCCLTWNITLNSDFIDIKVKNTSNHYL